MFMVVAEGLRMTAVGGSMVVRLTLKGIAFASALNLVVTFTHSLDIVSEKMRSIDSGT